MSGFSWQSTFELERIEDPGDYAGGSLVWISGDPVASKTAAERARSARWRQLFSSAPHITGMMLERPRQATLELLPSLPQLRELWIRDYVSNGDLEAIARIERLEVLYLGYPRKISDYSALGRLSHLRYLAVFGSHDSVDYSSFGSLVHLEHLSVGRGGRGRPPLIDDFDWVGSLTELQTLEIPAARPKNPDVSVIAALPRLARLCLTDEAEVRRSVEALASAHPAFAQAAREYGVADEIH